MGTEFRFRCPTCQFSTREGLLWLGGGDWLTCPTCDGTGVGKGVEYRYTPKEKLVFVPGSRMKVERKLFLPQHQAQHDREN